ncbi:RNA-binding protein [uncultured Brevundimonas sp.]|uniref:RNA-binding protein n=1 Tax=uncultured Brevundimonas sp. TaxID=213418 RepID=UPI0030EECF55
MSAAVEVFLDAMPGETRGMVFRDGLPEHLLIQRESDVPQHRLGARSVGRVTEVNAGLRGAFVDLGAGEPVGFLPLGREATVRNGDRIEVEVTAEPRDGKGPGLRQIGSGEGTPRLLEAGPDVATQLASLAPDANVETGLAAIAAGHEAVEAALGQTTVIPGVGLDLAVQRTRALIAVDIDFAPVAGRDARKGRERANREGLVQAARLIRLKRWGGLVAIDLVGTGQDGEMIQRTAKTVFGGDPAVVIGPVNRFGVLSLSLPWRLRPIESVLGRTVEDRALDTVRALRHRLLDDTATPRFTAVCAPDEAAIAAPLVARLGPRAALRIAPGPASGAARIEED